MLPSLKQIISFKSSSGPFRSVTNTFNPEYFLLKTYYFTLRGIDPFSGKTTLSKLFFVPFENRCMLKGNNLLPLVANSFFPFRVDLFSEGAVCRIHKSCLACKNVGLLNPCHAE